VSYTVLEAGDHQSSRLPRPPWQARLKEQSASQRGMLEALLAELEQSGVLGAEAVGRIKEKGATLGKAHLRESGRVRQGFEDYFP
jgi:hypothetical protein